MLYRYLLTGSAAVCALLLGRAPAAAWDCKDSKTVKLPPQRITIETSPPHVGVKERLTSRSVTAVGTLYMPLQTPVVGFGLAAPAAPAPSIADSPLNRALEAEQYKIRAAAAQAAFDAEVKALQELRQKLASGAAEKGGPTTTDVTAIRQSIDKINESLKILDERMTAVEKLLLVHDNYLRAQVEKKEPPKLEPDKKDPMKVEVERIPLPNPALNPPEVAPR